MCKKLGGETLADIDHDNMLQALSEANGSAAASLAVAEKYVSAFGELAKEQTHQLIPAFASLFQFFSGFDELVPVYNKPVFLLIFSVLRMDAFKKKLFTKGYFL